MATSQARRLELSTFCRPRGQVLKRPLYGMVPAPVPCDRNGRYWYPQFQSLSTRSGSSACRSDRRVARRCACPDGCSDAPVCVTLCTTPSLSSHTSMKVRDGVERAAASSEPGSVVGAAGAIISHETKPATWREKDKSCSNCPFWDRLMFRNRRWREHSRSPCRPPRHPSARSPSRSRRSRRPPARRSCR